MGLRTSFRIVGRALRQWSANRDSVLGAALAYYTLFSLTPLVIFSITIAGMVFDEQAARDQVHRHLREAVDGETADAIFEFLEHAQRPQGGPWAITLGFAVLVVGALGVFLHVRSALCTIWKLEPPRGSTVLGILLDYLLALVMVVVTGLFLLASLAVSTVLPRLIDFIERHAPDNTVPWRLVELGLSLMFLTLLFAALYRILSGKRIAWRYVGYGSLIAALLFTLGKTLMGYYLAYFPPASAYGAAGSVVIFMLWVYYSSHILFFGAELIQARRTRHEWLSAG